MSDTNHAKKFCFTQLLTNVESDEMVATSSLLWVAFFLPVPVTICFTLSTFLTFLFVLLLIHRVRRFCKSATL